MVAVATKAKDGTNEAASAVGTVLAAGMLRRHSEQADKLAELEVERLVTGGALAGASLTLKARRASYERLTAHYADEIAAAQLQNPEHELSSLMRIGSLPIALPPAYSDLRSAEGEVQRLTRRLAGIATQQAAITEGREWQQCEQAEAKHPGDETAQADYLSERATAQAKKLLPQVRLDIVAAQGEYARSGILAEAGEGRPMMEVVGEVGLQHGEGVRQALEVLLRAEAT
jgi:hypothetical protein